MSKEDKLNSENVSVGLQKGFFILQNQVMSKQDKINSENVLVGYYSLSGISKSYFRWIS